MARRKLNRRVFLGAAGAAAVAASREPGAAAQAPPIPPRNPDDIPLAPELPAAGLADLHRAVAATIASKRLGKPVFVRYTVQSHELRYPAIDRLSRITAAVAGWVGEKVERITAVGAAESGQLSLMVEFAGAATAAISLTRGRPRGAGVDLMIVGSRGTAYFDGGTAELWDVRPELSSAGPADAAVTAAIEKALKTGQPAAV